MKKRLSSALFLLLFGAALLLPLTGCDTNGPAEELGENLNEAADELDN